MQWLPDPVLHFFGSCCGIRMFGCTNESRVTTDVFFVVHLRCIRVSSKFTPKVSWPGTAAPRGKEFWVRED